MPRVEEYLLFSAQCRFMADWSPNPAEKAEWDHLAHHWMREAMGIVEAEADDGPALEAGPTDKPKAAE
jgi:hypothetical protein